MRMSPEQKEALGQGHLVNHNEQRPIPAAKLRRGNLKNRIPVYLSDGKTIVFVHPSKDTEAVREKYEKHIAEIG